MDWQIDKALELGIITELQATEEMQRKLEEFDKSCVDNYTCANESRVDCYPSRILESEHKEVLSTLNKEYTHDIAILGCKINELNNIIYRKNQYIYDLKKQLEKGR